MTKNIELMGMIETKDDLYKILKESFEFSDFDFRSLSKDRFEEILLKWSDAMFVPLLYGESYLKKSEGCPFSETVSKVLIEKISNIWMGLQRSWKNEDMNAKKTLEERAGKCVGITNLFIALSRNSGIPSRRVNGGYFKGSFNEGQHAWAVSYFYPFGWIEIDPTNNEFTDFNYDSHLYQFSYLVSHPPLSLVIERKEDVQKEEIEEILDLLKVDEGTIRKVFKDRSCLRRKKEAYKFFKSLKNE
jgi:hypothetical protein